MFEGGGIEARLKPLYITPCSIARFRCVYMSETNSIHLRFLSERTRIQILGLITLFVKGVHSTGKVLKFGLTGKIGENSGNFEKKLKSPENS